MAIDTSQLVDYSWADLAKAAKQAMMARSLGGASVRTGIVAVDRMTIDEAKKLYELAITNLNDESPDSAGGIALAKYGER